MLYRSTDRLCRRGAPMQNLAHSASFESLDKDAPSKAGTKHLGTDITDKSPSVSFVSSLGAPFPRGDDCDADLSEARSNQHSSQRLCSVCGQPARFGYVVRLLHGEEGGCFSASLRPEPGRAERWPSTN